MTDLTRSHPTRSQTPAAGGPRQPGAARRLSGLGGASLAAGVGALVLLAPAASAADQGPRPAAPVTVSSNDQAAAAKTLTSQDTTDRIASFFVRLEQRQQAKGKDTLNAQVTRDEAARQAPKLVGSTVPVYSLNPDFVRGTGKASTPVAEFAYLASEARSSSGAAATVWTVRDAKTQQWTVANVISGTDEVSFGRKTAGDLVFTEPQIAAWYALDGDRVLPLNKAARDAVGTRGTTVAAYQDRVHKAYGDKLPGSAYQRNGQFGGYGNAAEQSAPMAEQAAPAAPAKARTTASDAPSSSGLGGAALVATVAGGGALLIGAGAAATRLRRRTAG
ncbi:hypothetical protein ACMA1D_16430 [Streptomyces sp. 796.1]|uniref:hypothetical protein n=1 Tax=Streptomyces sp. 796.1 TaxID=3163029 RepID=UPI0039C8F3C7